MPPHRVGGSSTLLRQRLDFEVDPIGCMTRHEPTGAVHQSLNAVHDDPIGAEGPNCIVFIHFYSDSHSMSISRFDISASPIGFYTYIQGYFDLDWSNRHFVHACAVSSQWPLSVYEVLVA